jgi:hypothetical protein
MVATLYFAGAKQAAAQMAVPTVSNITGTLLSASASAHGVGFTLSIAVGSGLKGHLIGFTVTGNPGNSYGAGQITVSGLSGGNLWYEFVLTGQVSGNPASTNQLNVVFPVPIESTSGPATVTLTIPALGNSTSITYATMQAVVY